MIRNAGELRIPFTSGILIGIGETARERVEALLALRDLHEAHGHIQEVIVQNFRAKPDTPMGGRRRAGAGGADDRLRDRAPGDGAGDEHPGPAQPVRRLRAAAAGRDQRLGRRLPPHPRLRQPGGPLAGHRPASGELSRDAGYALARAAHRLPGVPHATTTWSTRACAATCGPSPTTTASPCRGSPTPWRRWRRERHLLPRRPAPGAPAGPPRARAGRPPVDDAAVATALADGLLPVETGRADSPAVAWVADPDVAMELLARGVAGWRITVRATADRAATSRRPRPHRRGVPAHRPGRAGGGDRARLAAGDRHPRLGGGGVAGGGARRDRRRRGRPGRRRLGRRRGGPAARRDRPAGRSSSAPRCRWGRRSTTPAPTSPGPCSPPGSPRPTAPAPAAPATRGRPAATRRRRCRPGGCRRSGRTRPGRRRRRRRASDGSTRTWRGSSSAASPTSPPGWRRSSACSGPAATRWRRSRRSPTSCAAAAAATRSPTSSTATSTTPTSATSAAASAASPRARRASTCAATRTS